MKSVNNNSCFGAVQGTDDRIKIAQIKNVKI